MANVAETKGRLGAFFCRRSSLLPFFLVETLTASPTDLLRLRDFMYRGFHFAFHFTELHPFRNATRFVEEVNESARRAADEDHEKAERSDKLGFFDRHATNVVEHDLEEFFAQTNSSKA